MTDPQEPSQELPAHSEIHPVAKKIVEDFIADVRKLTIIIGSRSKTALMLNVSVRSIKRWFLGDGLPLFSHYLAVKCLLADELARAKREFSLPEHNATRTQQIVNRILTEGPSE